LVTPVDYAEFVRPLVEEFRGEVALKSVVLEYENSPPAVKVPLNPRSLSRVFHNLFGNAVDAMPKGGVIKLRFDLTDREVITEIEDTGRGIAPEVVDRLFEAFVTFGKPRGTGLGLSITRKIVEEHQGKMSARNRPGGGAIFSFRLPRQVSA
jgi:signal transduction histidine kinase